MTTTEAKTTGPVKTSRGCPSDGNPLYSGVANGDILVCVDGCSTAFDPALLDSTDQVAIGPWSVDAVADKEAVVIENTTPPSPDPSKEQYVGPTEVPASVGVGEDTTPLLTDEAPAPAPPSTPTTPPAPPTPLVPVPPK